MWIGDLSVFEREMGGTETEGRRRRGRQVADRRTGAITCLVKLGAGRTRRAGTWRRSFGRARGQNDASLSSLHKAVELLLEWLILGFNELLSSAGKSLIVYAAVKAS